VNVPDVEVTRLVTFSSTDTDYITIDSAFAYGVKSRKTYPKVGRCRLTL